MVRIDLSTERYGWAKVCRKSYTRFSSQFYAVNLLLFQSENKLVLRRYYSPKRMPQKNNKIPANFLTILEYEQGFRKFYSLLNHCLGCVLEVSGERRGGATDWTQPMSGEQQGACGWHDPLRDSSLMSTTEERNALWFFMIKLFRLSLISSSIIIY